MIAPETTPHRVLTFVAARNMALTGADRFAAEVREPHVDS